MGARRRLRWVLLSLFSRSLHHPTPCAHNHASSVSRPCLLETNSDVALMSQQGLIAAFWRSFFGPGSHQHQSAAALQKRPDSVDSGKKLNKRAPRPPRQNRKSREGAAAQHFKGAQVVQKPEDAYNTMRKSSDAHGRTDSAVSGLFDGAFCEH